MSRRVAVTSVEISSAETNDIRCEIAVRNDMELLMYHYIILFFVKSLLPYDTRHISRAVARFYTRTRARSPDARDTPCLRCNGVIIIYNMCSSVIRNKNASAMSP
jgi:hypothetical protein